MHKNRSCGDNLAIIAPSATRTGEPGVSIELSVVVPTYNEKDNVLSIIESVERVLDGHSWEIIFVDDNSPDGTADFVKTLAREDERIRCIRRVNRRGLTSAAMEGLLASAARYVAVMDADLQHDESLLKTMLQKLDADEADIVIGSRYMAGGSAGGGLNRQRLLISRIATWMGKFLLKTEVSDPMSGYFMLKREVFEPVMPKLSGQGFKILLDLLSSTDFPVRVAELPYVMRQRRSGESKLDMMIVSEYYLLLLDKLVGRYIPVRFLLFATVGLFGVGVHVLSLWLFFKGIGMAFEVSQLLATVVAMTSNFVLNNRFTYRDMRLRGRQFYTGLLSFYLACSVGAFINVGVSDFMYEHGIRWIWSGIVGAFIGSVWNYAMTSTFTWRKKTV